MSHSDLPRPHGHPQPVYTGCPEAGHEVLAQLPEGGADRARLGWGSRPTTGDANNPVGWAASGCPQRATHFLSRRACRIGVSDRRRRSPAARLTGWASTAGRRRRCRFDRPGHGTVPWLGRVADDSVLRACIDDSVHVFLATVDGSPRGWARRGCIRPDPRPPMFESNRYRSLLCTPAAVETEVPNADLPRARPTKSLKHRKPEVPKPGASE